MGVKRFFDYDQESLAAMSPEQIKALIDIEVMCQAVEPVTKPEKVTLEDVGIKPTVEAFLVGDLVFLDYETAKSVATMSLWREAYDWSIGSQYAYLEEKPRRVETKFFFEEGVIKSRSEQLKAMKNTSSTYSAELKVYNEYLAKLEGISGEVWNAVNEANRWIAKVNCARETNANYVKLADGDTEVARKFFVNTFAASPHLIREIYPDYEEPEVSEVPGEEAI